jgi:hypothetical protein
MSAAFGHDFGGVRVHSDTAAAASARAVNALAYTVGSTIVFGEGKYNPRNPRGQSLLAHELAHVVQQAGASPRGDQLEIAPPHSTAEGHADTAAGTLGDGRPVSRLSTSPMFLARADAAAPEKSWWARTKESVYTGTTDYLRNSITESMKIERAYAATLSPRMRPIVEKLIDIHEVCAEIGMSLILAIISVVGGLLTGIGQLLMGLARIVIGLGELIGSVILDAVTGGDRTERWVTDFVNTITALPGALKKLVTDWVEEFKHASSDHQTVMIGELTGQILALIASFAVAPSRAGTAAELGGGGAGVTAAEAAGQGAKVLPFVRPAAQVAARGTEAAGATWTVRAVGGLKVWAQEAAQASPLTEAAPAAKVAPLAEAAPLAKVIPLRAPPVPVPLIPAPVRIVAVAAGHVAGKAPATGPAPGPVAVPAPKPKPGDKQPCPDRLPILWPEELPMPDPWGLIRTPGAMRDEENLGGRGLAQAMLAEEIANSRGRRPPPRPCFNALEKQHDPLLWNAPYDAHHIHPLGLGGVDVPANVCALEAHQHQAGHPRLNNQTAFLDEYMRCGVTSGYLNNHPAGQTYYIAGTK